MARPDHGGDSPWVMRTYSGHTSAKASNALYRANLAKGQTGLSIAFDLPTQTGYDPDAPEAAGEVGKVGVPVAHLGHIAQLMEGIPVGEMNTSMTINATAPWLLGLYIAHAQKTGVDPATLQGTTQNDIVKEYLSRGTYIFPPDPSRRLTVDTVAYTLRHVPKWNPINVCSYHLQEAGATPVQEIAYALATAIGVLDAVRDSKKIDSAEIAQVVGRISFFVNAGIRFVEETCKMRAFSRLWELICTERYGVEDPKLRRFRYGVQVNSLGLPRPWDQQWSLRVQQILAFETDLLEYDDLFDGSHVVEERAAELAEEARTELEDVLALGGAFEAVDELKRRLVRSQAERMRRIETGELKVVGVNCFIEGERSPLVEGDASVDTVLRVDPRAEAGLRADMAEWRTSRDEAAVQRALKALRCAAEQENVNVMPATIGLARAGGTTGEWAQTLRDVFGEYRASTGVSGGVGHRGAELTAVLEHTHAVTKRTGRPPRLLVAKPGLDGHSNGAEQIAVAARDAGFEVVYEGIRLTPEQIATAARDEDVDVVGISILSGSHLELVPEVLDRLRAVGVDVPVVVGGIIPPADAKLLREKGVTAVYTPRDFQLTHIIDELVTLVEHHREVAAT